MYWGECGWCQHRPGILCLRDSGRFCPQGRVQARHSGIEQGEKPFLLVFGETLEDTFVPFLCGTVGRKLEKIAAELPHDAHQDNGNTKQEDDICDVVVLVCPLGDAKWYQKFLWGDEVNPAGTSKYAVRVFDGERFKELRKWAKRGDFHRRDFTR